MLKEKGKTEESSPRNTGNKTENAEPAERNYEPEELTRVLEQSWKFSGTQ